MMPFNRKGAHSAQLIIGAHIEDLSFRSLHIHLDEVKSFDVGQLEYPAPYRRTQQCRTRPLLS